MTIQEVIQNCNKKEVANTYIYKYGFMSSLSYDACPLDKIIFRKYGRQSKQRHDKVVCFDTEDEVAHVCVNIRT